MFFRVNDMPVIKYIPVHQSPKRLISYVLQSRKTDDLKYATGLNVPVDNINACYDAMRDTFEIASGEKFFKRSLDGLDGEKKKKEKVRLHHYIQSFAPGETTPEEAHKIGLEWAREIFGNDHEVIISTHIDKGHIHNHFAVASYDLEGKAWYANKKTLRHCREVSDRLAKEHGLSVIENPKHKSCHKYGEWLAQKNGTSWKQKLCDDIDRLILQDNVKSVDDLVRELRNMGYEVKHGKYISIKAAKNRKPIRSFRLGNGYAIEELRYRIENKNPEMPLSEVMKYEGIQREYAICLRQLQIMVYRNLENPLRADYRTLRQSAELLSFITEKKITSAAQFEDEVNAAAERCDEVRNRKKELEAAIRFEEKFVADAARFLELINSETLSAEDMAELEKYEYLSSYRISGERDIEAHKDKLSYLKSHLANTDDELTAAESEKKKYGDNYRIFLQQSQSDYDFIREQVKREKEEMERAAKLSEQEKEQEENNRKNKYQI